MSNGLSLRTTVLLVALAFGVTFAVQALLDGGSSAATPRAAKQGVSEVEAAAPGAAPDLELAGASVPALREPRQPRKRKRKPQPRKEKPTVRKVVKAAPRARPAPVMPAATAQPTPAPTAAPRYVAPAPRHVAPAPPRPTAPKPAPAPTSAPPASGEFDTSGEP